MFRNPVYLLSNVRKISVVILWNIFTAIGNEKESGVIYILLWTSSDKEPFSLFEGMAKQIFFNRQCVYQNCFFTNDTAHFVDVTLFDVIIFNIVNIQGEKNDIKIPNQRSKNQLYTLFSIEPAELYPLSTDFNDFFNITWTYKFDSNLTFKYITVMSKQNEVIGPNKNMNWIDKDEMKPISKYIKRKLRQKTIAAAWFVSNCFHTKSNRLEFAQELRTELNKIGLQLDIYGNCGTLECLKLKEECFALIESDYYFYLAFENSFCEDYVSEKVLIALEHFAVPVVYGGANYSRFLAPGMYLNARTLGPAKLANEMKMLINDTAEYDEFFKWHRYYTFQSPVDNAFTDEICGLCEFLNKVIERNTTNIFPDIARWWNGRDIVPTKKKKVVSQNNFIEVTKEDESVLKWAGDFLKYYFDV